MLIPGEPEAAAERRSAEHGVSLDRGHHESLLELGRRYDLPLPELGHFRLLARVRLATMRLALLRGEPLPAREVTRDD